ncbi:MAG TPA: metal-dependent hydrolase [Bdellovibrionota bacterium]|nr:metal-dependent hydrolase [Bdellovibrionota bacterium]
MDPITQGAFGALWAGIAAAVDRERRHTDKPSRGLALGLGALSGMASDLDVLISSKSDPLLALEYHRHFTHSLIFIPIGALICALVFWPLFKKRFASFRQMYLICFAGFASHGLLDAFTSYGTQLLWPFSNYRVAWDSMPIVDPLFTLPLIGFLLWKSRRSIAVATLFTVLYLGFGFVQRNRAIDAVLGLAQSRGHGRALRIQAKPSFGNLLVYRGLYEYGGRYYADAVRISPLGAVKYYPGDSLPKASAETFAIIFDTKLYRDIERFSWFSDDFLAVDPRDANVLGDFRYSMLPNTVDPMWGIRVDLVRADEHAEFVTMRSLGDRSFGKLWEMILGR